MEKSLFLVVKVTFTEGSELEGPEITDVLQDIIDVGFIGDEVETEGIKGIKVLTGFCEE